MNKEKISQGFKKVHPLFLSLAFWGSSAVSLACMSWVAPDTKINRIEKSPQVQTYLEAKTTLERLQEEKGRGDLELPYIPKERSYIKHYISERKDGMNQLEKCITAVKEDIEEMEEKKEVKSYLEAKKNKGGSLYEVLFLGTGVINFYFGSAYFTEYFFNRRKRKAKQTSQQHNPQR